MSRRKWVLLFAVVAGLIAVAAMSFTPSKPSLLLLDWANKAKADKPPTAVLIEMGLKDERRPTGRAGRPSPGRKWWTAKATASATATSSRSRTPGRRRRATP